MEESQLIEKYYKVALDVVMKCGPLMREGYDKVEPNYETKSAFYDLVTVYDKQIEDRLVAELGKVFPDSKFIGEEDSATKHSTAALTDEPTWIIDPIDGTTNFIHKIPLCCISLGLAIKKELVVGIVYNPIANEIYSARKGCGAFMNGQPIHVRPCQAIKDAVIAYEISMIHAASVRDKNIKRLYKLGSNAQGTRTLGSAAVTLCYLARGSIDLFHVEDLQPWDIAGGAVILREAGGVVYNTEGGEFNIMLPNLVAAASDPLAKAAVQLIDEAKQMNDYTFT